MTTIQIDPKQSDCAHSHRGVPDLPGARLCGGEKGGAIIVNASKTSFDDRRDLSPTARYWDGIFQGYESRYPYPGQKIIPIRANEIGYEGPNVRLPFWSRVCWRVIDRFPEEYHSHRFRGRETSLFYKLAAEVGGLRVASLDRFTLYALLSGYSCYGRSREKEGMLNCDGRMNIFFIDGHLVDVHWDNVGWVIVPLWLPFIEGCMMYYEDVRVFSRPKSLVSTETRTSFVFL